MRTIVQLIIIGFILNSCASKDTPSSNAELEKTADKLVQHYIDDGKAAGISIAVFRGKEKLLLKSYGFADLEFDVKLPADASFEIGSVTKQFTAAAIFQLLEQGKLGLDDDVTKYIKFDTQGKKVTIRHLLTHTSGIKGYTELPWFEQIADRKFARDTLLRLVEKEPFDFDPGEALIYSNSGFFMSGLIIEKVSGLSFEEYVSKNLFDKAGMKNSYYGSENKIVKNRSHGYDMSDKGLVRTAYLDHTWPYAAGSLCSTVEDLVKWNDALHHGKILSSQIYDQFITPAKLNDGTVTHYAHGISVVERDGKRVIEHGGGINGFYSLNRYYPADDMSIVVLINTAGPVFPAEITNQIADFIYTKPPQETHTFDGDISKLVGVYQGRGRGTDLVVNIIKNDSGLSATQTGEDKPKPLQYLGDNKWSVGNSVYIFSGTGDDFNELRVDETYGYYILKKTE